MTLDQLRVLLLALLPKDGSPKSADWLADTAYVWPRNVHEALESPLAIKQVAYDVTRDSYCWLRGPAS